LWYVLAFLALALSLGASAPLLISIVGWSKGNHHYIEIAKEMAPLITPLVTVVLTVGSLAMAAGSRVKAVQPAVLLNQSVDLPGRQGPLSKHNNLPKEQEWLLIHAMLNEKPQKLPK
jgi:hypothetical protein